MKLIATYANRKDDPEIIELACAWDEYSVDGNYEGWLAEKESALNSWGDELFRHVDVEIDVPMNAIYAVLIPDVAVAAHSVTILPEDS